MHTETMHAQRSVHSKKEKHGKIFSGTNDDSRKSKHSDSKSEVINESESSIVSERQVDIMTRGESGKNDDSHTHINETKGTSASARKSGSSSSSESSFDDYFGMNELKFATSGSSTSKSGKDYVSSSESSSKSEVDNSLRVNTSSTFKVYNVAKPQKGTSPISSPPVQVMERTGVYDPARIPSSVFERNPNQLDWSEASNESLFSLHVGNNSFSRERMLGEAKSGELNFVSGEFTKSGELNLFSRTPSILIEEIDTTRKSVEVENPQTTETSDEAFKSEERLSEDQDEIKSTDHPASSKSSKANVSSLSHDSENSTRSFAFPIKKRPRSFCYCSNCSWAFCYKWPTCCHTWPSCKCSNCGWAFCYCWNNSYSKSFDHASPILAEEEKNNVAKKDVPRQRSFNKQESHVTSDSIHSSCSCFRCKQTYSCSSCCCCCSWFQCFSCPSFSCNCKPSCSLCKCCSKCKCCC